MKSFGTKNQFCGSFHAFELMDGNRNVINGISHSHNDFRLVDILFQAKVNRLNGAFKRASFGEGDNPRTMLIEKLERLLFTDKYYRCCHIPLR